MVNFPSLDPTTLRLPDAVRAQIAADLKDNTQTEGAAIAGLLSGFGSGNYTKPAGGIPETDLAAAVQTTLGKADSALQVAPVTSVAGKTGVVALAAADVGLSNVDNTSDVNKPVSTAQASALALKGDKSALPQAIYWTGSAWSATADPSRPVREWYSAGYIVPAGSFPVSLSPLDEWHADSTQVTG